MPKSIEERTGITYTSNNIVETRVNIKINKNGSTDDMDAYSMIEYLKEKNINISKHIRLLLALEYRGQIFLNEKYQVTKLKDCSDKEINNYDEGHEEITVSCSSDVNEYIKYDESKDVPPSDDPF